MQHRIWLLLVLVLVLILASRTALAEAPLYVETFNNDPSGWTSLGEASLATTHGALDNRGDMEAKRDNRYPPQHRITSEAGTHLTGSLAENFGSNRLVYTFYARMLHPEASFPVAVSIESGDT